LDTKYKKMTRILILILFCFSCNTNISESDNYPHEIKDNHLEDMFDTTKWLLYCLNISNKNDIGYLFGDTSNKVKLYNCTMRHSYLDIKEDTIEIAPQFFYNDTLIQIPVEKKFTRFMSVKFVSGEPVSFGAGSLYLPYNIAMDNNREERFLNYMSNKKIDNEWLKNQIKMPTKS